MPDEPGQSFVEQRHCRFCRSMTEHLVEAWNHGMHGHKAICTTPGCSGFAWLPKDHENPTRRPASHRGLLAKYDRGFCELCLRTRSELRPSDTLMAHHVREFQDEGEPTRENVWIVCTACHALIHWQRIYNGRKNLPSVEKSA